MAKPSERLLFLSGVMWMGTEIGLWLETWSQIHTVPFLVAWLPLWLAVYLALLYFDLRQENKELKRTLRNLMQAAAADEA